MVLPTKHRVFLETYVYDTQLSHYSGRWKHSKFRRFSDFLGS